MRGRHGGDAQGDGGGVAPGAHNEFSGEALSVVQAGVVHGDIVVHQAGASPHVTAVPDMGPVPPSRLVSRVGVERELVEALRCGVGRVVLCGAGGYGKTTLAGWACRRPEVRERFPDGVLWAQLGQAPSAGHLVASLSGLVSVMTGSGPGTYADVPSAAHAFRSSVAGTRMLLVLDDVWSAGDIGPFLDAGDQVTVLVTTRRARMLDGDVVTVAVDAMSDDEGVTLLGSGLAAEPEALAPLVRRAGHWPLALDMLSGVLRSLSERHAMGASEAVAGLLAELDGHGLATLDELSDTDVPRGIARTLELSLGELASHAGGPGRRDRFVSLAAFPEGEVVPYWLLRRMWGLSEVRVRAEADGFVGRSLASAPHGDGLRLHDVTRDALRHAEPEAMAGASTRLLDSMRPAAGWHRLPEEERPFLRGLAFHLRQAGRAAELADLLRDMRFLAVRLAESGPTGLEADLELYAAARPDDSGAAYTRGLTELLRQEGHLFSGGGSPHDVGLTFESRMVGRPALRGQVRHAGLAGSGGGLVAWYPLPDRDDGSLLRSFPARQGGRCFDIDWHPHRDLLATVGYDPALQIVSADGERVRTVRIRGAVLEGVRWSPDGTRLAVIGDTSRFAHLQPAPRSSVDGYGPQVYALAVYDPWTGTELDATPVSGGPVYGVPDFCWAPDGTSLAVVEAGNVSMWEPGSGAAPRRLPGAGQEGLGGCDALDWHLEHGLIAHVSGGPRRDHDEGALLRWPAPSAPEPGPPETWRHPALWGAGRGLRWRPSGHTVALKARTTLVVDPFARGILWQDDEWRNNNGPLWSPDGSRLALRQALRTPALLEVRQMPSDRSLARGAQPELLGNTALGVDHSVSDVLAWHPEGSRVATTNDQRIIKLWRLQGGSGNVGDGRPNDRLTHVMWHTDGRTLLLHTIGREWFSLDSLEPHTGMRSCAAPSLRRNPADRRRWPEDVGALRDGESSSTPGILVEFARDERTYALGRWFQPLRVFSRGEAHAELCSADGARSCSAEGDRSNAAERERSNAADGARWGPADWSRRWYTVCFTPSGEKVVAAAADGSWQIKYFAVWHLTGAAHEHPEAQWTTESLTGQPGPSIGHVWRITAGERHAAVVADPGLVGLFALEGMRHICWVKVNGTVRDAAFDPSGKRLAVAGDAGVYLFAVQDPEEPEDPEGVSGPERDSGPEGESGPV
ncbi:NB-ARC domain-containing protein [Streptomyces iconiensis]|uniref:NB-ARC domain-containing protein n=1 Tax=Streptomyces iconiensis TaxID=1384038 RepID=A0ABT6ZS25_9ACTN|nr:NB-ARC domain-containing protein [Streptomyces iconiensis]MDJ1131870.1 NB-ARC domain-containing protein [Streptomyces iconiensis]